jgi:TolA-binding protein
MTPAHNTHRLLALLVSLLLGTGLLQIAPAQDPESTTEKAFNAARQLYNDGKMAEALAAFQQFESQNKFSTAVPQAIYFQGWCWVGLHKYPEAIDTFDRLIKVYPTAPVIPEAILKEADCYRDLKNYPKALVVYRQFETQYPKHAMMPQAMLGEAWTLFQQNDLKTARDIVGKVCAQFTNDAIASLDSQFLLGQILTAEKNYDAANELYQQIATSDNPRASDALFLQAETLFGSGRFQEALDRFLKFAAANKDPQLLETADFRIAACYYGLHDFAQARDHFNSFLQRHSNGKLMPDALFRLGRSYFEISQKATDPKLVQANLADAVKSYELIRAQVPNNELLPEVTFQLGYLYAYLGAQDAPKSLALFQEFVERWPENHLVPEALYQIAHNEFAQSKFAAAISAYKQLIDKYPENDLTPFAVHEIAAVYRTVGSAMLRQEQFAQARNAFQNSLALYSTDAHTVTVAQIGLGEACLGLNDFDDAEKTFKQILTANPQNTDAELGLAKVYLSQGKDLPANAKAVDLLNKVMASARGEHAGEAAFLLGNYFFNLQDNEKENKKTALAYYLRVALLISGPRGEEAAFRSGQCDKALGNTEAARSAFQAYLRRFPTGRFIADAQQELAALPASPPQS